jgi:tRNA (guanine26-N2/guanine27-N2)-dimethyltransferase
VLQPLALNKRPNQPTNPHVIAAQARVPKPKTDGFYGRNYHIGGPIWNDPIHDPEFVKILLKNIGSECPEKPLTPGAPTGRRWKKMHGVLTAINEESECFDCPLYYHIPDLANTMHCTCPTLHLFMSALLNAGYRVSNTHCKSNSIKTDAPNEVIWDIMRAWVLEKGNSVSKKRMTESAPVSAILAKKSTTKINFTLHSRFMTASGNKVKNCTTATRFLPNPEKFWGPKSRAKKVKKSDNDDDDASGSSTSFSSSPKRRKVQED